ncbi:MAG: cyanoexosortase C [Chloroflexota bacterium]
MKRFRQYCQLLFGLTTSTTKTVHGWLVLGGLLIGLLYFPYWFGYLFQRALQGKTAWFLIACMLVLAFSEIIGKRRQLKKLAASAEDRFLGHSLIVSGIILFPFCRFAIWPQSLVWLMILAGIICSSWGVGFFYQFKFPAFLLGLTVYPRLGIVSRAAWEFFIPPNFLENTMAGISAWALRLVGWSAVADGQFISFPEGAVEVGWGCNGLDMAITMMLAGLLMGIFFQQSRTQIVRLEVFAFSLALIANIPRLMVVTIAYVYWGKDWFRFWHGFWGGQIFVGILFTLYYYAVMALISRQNQKSTI